MKKILQISFLLFLLFTLSACGKKKVDDIAVSKLKPKIDKIAINESEIINKFSYDFRLTWLNLKENNFKELNTSWNNLENDWQSAKNIFVMQTALLRAKQDAQVLVIDGNFKQGGDSIKASEFTLTEKYLKNIYKNWLKYCNREVCQNLHNRDIAWISVYGKLKPLLNVKTSNESIALLPSLKLEFAKAREYSWDLNKGEYIDNFAVAIAKLEKSSSKDLAKNQENIFSIFKNIFSLQENP